MSTPIQFRQGQFQIYVAGQDFSLGGADTVKILKGDTLEFDGNIVHINGGNPKALPQLRGAYKAGWIVLQANYDEEETYIPPSAGVRIRAAQGGNPLHVKTSVPVTTVEAEDQEVMSVGAHAQSTREGNANKRAAGRRVASSDVEAQDGVVVRTLTTPTHQTANLQKQSAFEIIQAAENVKIKPGKGRSRSDVMAAMSEEEREDYLARVDASRSFKPGSDITVVDEEPRVVRRVGQPKNAVDSGGMTIRTTVSKGSTDITDLSGTDGKAVETIVEVEGIRMRNTNGLRVKPPVASVARTTTPIKTALPTSDLRRKIARGICSDFPDNYDFDATPRKKIARIQADFEDRLDVIRAVAAAETDNAFRGQLVAEFPEAFE